MSTFEKLAVSLSSLTLIVAVVASVVGIHTLNATKEAVQTAQDATIQNTRVAAVAPTIQVVQDKVSDPRCDYEATQLDDIDTWLTDLITASAAGTFGDDDSEAGDENVNGYLRAIESGINRWCPQLGQTDLPILQDPGALLPGSS